MNPRMTNAGNPAAHTGRIASVPLHELCSFHLQTQAFYPAQDTRQEQQIFIRHH